MVHLRISGPSPPVDSSLYEEKMGSQFTMGWRKRPGDAAKPFPEGPRASSLLLYELQLASRSQPSPWERVVTGRGAAGFAGWVELPESFFSLPQMQGLFCPHLAPYLTVVFLLCAVCLIFISPFLPALPLASPPFTSCWFTGNLTILWYDLV